MIEIIGNKYGRLKVLENLGLINGRTHYRCLCDCGNEKILMRNNLIRSTRSCGCLRHEAPSNKTHGQKGTRLYRIWGGMKTRCFNKNDHTYKGYGARGITMTADWLDFSNFYDWARRTGYTDELTIERIDNNGDYEPGNCKWITLGEQARNRRSTTYIEFKGQKKSLSEWSEITGIGSATLHGRINRGWPVEAALTRKPDKTQRILKEI